MGRLSETDYRDMLGLLHDAGEVVEDDPFPAPILDELRRLVPCDVLSYGEYDPDGLLFRRLGRLRLSGAPLEPVTPAIREAQLRLPHQHLHPPSASKFMPTLRWTDRLPLREQRKLAIYWEVGRPLRIEYQITVWLHDRNGRPLGYFAFDRRRPDFSDRDLSLLQTLGPHLAQLARNASQRLPASKNGLTSREREVLALVAQGKENWEIASLLYIAPGTVHKHLDNIYEKLGAHNRAEAVARARQDA
jgi:DNA-binding CsgD family transcriptional regulator